MFILETVSTGECYELEVGDSLHVVMSLSVGTGDTRSIVRKLKVTDGRDCKVVRRFLVESLLLTGGSGTVNLVDSEGSNTGIQLPLKGLTLTCLETGQRLEI